MFYNQNSFLPFFLYAKYLSEILRVLCITFADEIKTHSTLEFPGLNIRLVLFYLAFEMLKLSHTFSNPVIQGRCLKWIMAVFFAFMIVL